MNAKEQVHFCTSHKKYVNIKESLNTYEKILKVATNSMVSCVSMESDREITLKSY